MKRILNLKNFKLFNNGTKVDRELALDITELTLYSNTVTFIIGDRGAGKTPLASALGKIFVDKMHELNLNDNPEILKTENWKFQNLSGNPDTWVNINHLNNLLFCDDPTNNNESTGTYLINNVANATTSLIIGVDPDRLEEVFSCFLKKKMDKKILWLSSGKVFWEGDVDDFYMRVNELKKKYKENEPNKSSTFLFLEAINKSVLTCRLT